MKSIKEYINEQLYQKVDEKLVINKNTNSQLFDWEKAEYLLCIKLTNENGISHPFDIECDIVKNLKIKRHSSNEYFISGDLLNAIFGYSRFYCPEKYDYLIKHGTFLDRDGSETQIFIHNNMKEDMLEIVKLLRSSNSSIDVNEIMKILKLNKSCFQYIDDFNTPYRIVTPNKSLDSIIKYINEH